ncbi:MAG: type II secretion system protein [Pseudomonadota bacterium]
MNVKQPGFTLLEIILSMTLMSMVLSFLIDIYFAMNKKNLSPVIQHKAIMVANLYLDRILMLRFDENSSHNSTYRCDQEDFPRCSEKLGPEEKIRSEFDDVDDYSGLSETPPLSFNNEKLQDYVNYQVSVTVSYAGQNFGLPTRALKKIHVVVQAPHNTFFEITAFKSND